MNDASRNEWWEYQLVAEPDHTVAAALQQEQKIFESEYNESLGQQSLIIPIAQFSAKEPMEETLIRWIQNVCKLQGAFPVTLNNYSAFPPHTVFVRIQDPAPFLHLANRLKMLDGFIQSNDCPPLELVSRPYLNVAGSLSFAGYEKAMEHFAKRSFNASFKIEKLLLLKRAGVYSSWQKVNAFALASEGIETY